jgi:hypothetical protein
VQSLNPFNYSLSELKKALFAGIPLVFVLLSFLFGWIPPLGFEGSVLAVIPPLFVLIGVFVATNHSATYFRKALEAFVGSVVTVISYWTQVPASWDNKIALGITLIVAIVGVAWSSNVPPEPKPGS